MTLNEIRKDLKEIRYYYARKEIFDEVSNSVGIHEICKKVEIYNKAICFATPRLFDIYIGLYKNNNTQESLANKLGYTIEHIQRINNRLVKFFKDKFDEMEGKNNV